MESVRMGVIGCGRHASRAVFPNLHLAPVTLVSACDLDLSKAERVVRLFGGRKAYDNYEEMLAVEDLEAVIIVGHAERMHYRIGVDAMRAGVHVYTEKPPSASADQSFVAWKVSEETGKILMCGFKKRYAPAYQRAQALVSGGELGEAVSCTINYQKGPIDWFEIQSAIHIYDLCRFIMGDVKSVVSRIVGSGREQTHCVLLEYANGGIGLIENSSRRSWVVPTETVELTGENGWVSIDNVAYLQVYVDDRLTEQHCPNFTTSGISSSGLTGLSGELIHFAECVREGKKPVSDAESSYRSMLLCEAIRDSKGRVVCMDDLEKS